MRFIDPQTDFAFKKIFGSEQSKPILISFLNALVYQGKPRIQDLEIIDPYQAARVLGLKDSYLDVKAVLDDNTKVIIEMQCVYLQGFEQRILFNNAKAYSNQLLRGQRYRELNSVISLTITKFNLFNQFNDVISYFEFKERYHLIDYPYSAITMIFVELPKFTKEIDALENITDKWLYFMKEAGNLEVVPEKLETIDEIEQAFTIANEATLSVEELDKIQNQEFYLQDQEFLQQQAQKAQQAQQEARQAQQEAQQAQQEAQQAQQETQQAQQETQQAQQETQQAQQEAQEAQQELESLKQRQKSLILRQLNKKFSDIDQEIILKINNLSLKNLEDLAEVFLDFESLSDLINWLTNKNY